MTEIASLLATTKRLLKNQGFTYKEVAKSLKLSEPSIKRMFSSGRMTIDRLAQIADLLGFSLSELAQESTASTRRIATLTPEQEALLVSDMKLLLTAVCAINHWTLADIVATYTLTEAECLQRLLVLDRMALIALMPGNRIRLVIARDFDWLPNGPIRQFFRTQGQSDFLDSLFIRTGESLSFVHGMFTDAAFAEIQTELHQLRKRFAQLHEESLSAPLSQRSGASMLIALRRSWEPPMFARLRKNLDAKA